MTSVGHCVCLFVSWVTFVGHCVCLFVSWVTSVGHCLCLFVRLNKLCLGWGLSVCTSEKVMFGMGFVCFSV